MKDKNPDHSELRRAQGSIHCLRVIAVCRVNNIQWMRMYSRKCQADSLQLVVYDGNLGCRRLSSSGGVPGVLGGAGSTDSLALTPRTPGCPVCFRPPSCPSSSSTSPLRCTSQVAPGIWKSASLGDHYFPCHMPCG